MSKIFGLKKSDFFLVNIVFEPVKIYTDKIGCTLVKIWTKCRTSQNNIFIMQLPGEFSPFIEKKVVFCLVGPS
jgi:hypothetical protein